MQLRRFLLSATARFILRIICRLDTEELNRIPPKGPLILCINHINFLEIGIIQAGLYPRRLRGVAKRETWNHPVMRFLANAFEAIPLDRGGANISAFREIGETLEAGDFIYVAPEGTRSGDGILRPGKQGITMMALKTQVPILPVAHFGGEKVWPNMKRLRRTRVSVRVGRPFRLRGDLEAGSRLRSEMTREIMYQLADLLPQALRGAYTDPARKSCDYLIFMEPDIR